MSVLSISNLHVDVAGKQVLKGFDLTMSSGEVHVIMGPNGSGKSTLAHALAGHPGYQVREGSVRIDGVELLDLSPTERARHGLFLALQHPMEVPGVRPLDMLAAAGASREDLMGRMREEARRVELRPEVLERFLNVDLSGGERKRAEMVQLSILRPKFAMLDEIDSGLDVDALGAVARRLREATEEWECGVLAITHFRRLLHELTPTMIHVVSAGRVVATGGPELAERLERDGYEPFRVESR
ncbi:MAG: Fe-S cluster assembly ATPase SufC [Acidobacteriota bacterium]|nr:Fe-S cluster assembly ATPase SufC [Acidobacteriota bacterium]MDE3093219.1 Fe-S cluster assembly ATPase SufC [Acidobacteriota bacterium]MDE3146598.1 Fe-S cluster assembly ATPase SufC [Acidobacteriota bacterium]